MREQLRILKGDIYYADLGSLENEDIRQVLIVQGNDGNKYSPTTIISAITSKLTKAKLKTHVQLTKEDFSFLEKDSVILLEQVRTIDKKRLKNYIGHLDTSTKLKVSNALLTSFGEEDCLK